MREERTVVNNGIGVGGLLGVAFIVMKIMGIINWAWIWVLAPFWIPLAFIIVVLLITLVIVGIVGLFN